VVTVLLGVMLLCFGTRIVYPKVRTHYLAKEMAERGRYIVGMFEGWSLDKGRNFNVYPTTHTYGGWTSTGYFLKEPRWVSHRQYESPKKLLLDIIGIPDWVPVTRPTKEFYSSNNAWCITLDMNWSMPGQTPFVFTRNLAFTGTTVDTFVGLDKDALLFGDEFGVVVNFGGQATILTKDSTVKDFNPTGATNRFLRP